MQINMDCVADIAKYLAEHSADVKQEKVTLQTLIDELKGKYNHVVVFAALLRVKELGLVKTETGSANNGLGILTGVTEECYKFVEQQKQS